MSGVAGRIIWIDLETTGLDVNTDRIVEIACVVTEADLTPVEAGCAMVISQPEYILGQMSDWCKQTFTRNGLLQAIRSSNIVVERAENEVLSYVSKHTKSGECPLAGNSVSNDRHFLRKYMPRLAAHLHHHTIDVSTITELARRWYPAAHRQAPQKKFNHRAREDMFDSINELFWYRKKIFMQNE